MAGGGGPNGLLKKLRSESQMKTKLLLIVISILILTGLYFSFLHNEEKFGIIDAGGNQLFISEEEFEKLNLEKEEEENSKSSSDDFFSGRRIVSAEEYKSLVEEVSAMPTELEMDVLPVNSWELKGPHIMTNQVSATHFNGRIRDLEFEGLPGLRVGSGSGGLFKAVFAGIVYIPVPISNSMNTLHTGAFATKPGDTSTIFLGTGEPGANSGTGMWMTSNGGINWNQISLSPIPSQFYKIMYHPQNTTIMHAASNTGYFRSTNSGSSWTNIVSGHITALDVCTSSPTIVYIAKLDDGVYKSTNSGANFSRINNFPVGAGSFGFTALSIAPSNSNTAYFNVTNNAGATVGIYRTTNGGTSWEDKSYPGLHWGNQGWRNNAIAVCPTNPNLVLAGGGPMIRTTDGGTTWSMLSAIAHPDHCVIKWHSNGTTVYDGNDGGVISSADAGLTWSTSPSIFPVAEFLEIDAAAYGSSFAFVGGMQDLATVATLNGSNWIAAVSDSRFSCVDENNPSNMMGMLFYGPNIPHDIRRTTNAGINWITNNVDRDQFGGDVQDDRVNPVYYYVNNGNKVYYSTNNGVSWIQLGPALPFTVSRISVGRYTNPFAPVYAILESTTDKIRYYDQPSNTWVQRQASLPNNYFRKIGQHPNNNNVCYAYTYYNLATDKIFKTTNRGVTWTNITGNLTPGMDITGVIPHPTNSNMVFAGSTTGMWKTTNNGANWYRWINGMPNMLEIQSIAFVDSTIAGKFYIAAGSYGRSIWVREANGDDPLTGNNSNNNNIPKQYLLAQNFPNPFNPATTIAYDIPKASIVKMTIYDVRGKEMQVLVNENKTAGSYRVSWDASKFSSGVYFYKIEAGEFIETKKMMLVK